MFAVQMTEELTVEVQLVGDGVAPAVEGGGTLVHPTSVLKVRALPGNLPEALHFDLSSLTTYDAVITAADLVAPAGVTIQADPAEVIARVLAPRVEEAGPAPEAAPVEAAAADAEPAAG
jgi:large subunit ribosomal protein L25